jgi:hypothetical protein
VHAALIKERRCLFEILNHSALDDSWENANVDEVFDSKCHDVSTLSIVNLKLHLFVNLKLCLFIIDFDRYGRCHFTFSSDVPGFDNMIFGPSHDVRSSTNFCCHIIEPEIPCRIFQQNGGLHRLKKVHNRIPHR